MAKAKISYACTACGSVFPRWMGQCTECKEWNTVEEETSAPTAHLGSGKVSKAKPAKITSLFSEEKSTPRLLTHITEFDRVLGGGMVAGSAILLGGDPGIGKSTLLLQMAGTIGTEHKVLYISGEESVSQIQMRAKRLGVEGANVALTNSATVEVALATIAHEKPKVVVVDSIQTIYAESLESAPGTVSQIRAACHELTRAAKQAGSVIFFVGHVTKEGNIAGPRLLEHMVDTVLYFEGERSQNFRLLRSFKNRFGATNEIGVFEMVEGGLQEVANPSALFLEERPEGAAGSAVLATMNGTRPLLIEVQALVSRSKLAQPRRTTLGVDSARVAMIAAVLEKHGGYPLSEHDIYLNVTGGVKVSEPAADVAIAGALLSSLMNKPVESDCVLFGELGLSGEVRSVSHAEQRVKETEKLGFKSLICPALPKNTKISKAGLFTVKTVDDIAKAILG